MESLRKRHGARRLCLAGGLFLNSLIVAAIERNTGFEEVFVQPAAGNEGTSLGAAWSIWHHNFGRPRVAPMSDVYWGPEYSNDDVKQVLDLSLIHIYAASPLTPTIPPQSRQPCASYGLTLHV